MPAWVPAREGKRKRKRKQGKKERKEREKEKRIPSYPPILFTLLGCMHDKKGRSQFPFRVWIGRYTHLYKRSLLLCFFHGLGLQVEKKRKKGRKEGERGDDS
jgi:hypothetical protein